LLQRGFEVDVYEQAPRLEEVGAGVQLSPNGTRALRKHPAEAADRRRIICNSAASL